MQTYVTRIYSVLSNTQQPRSNSCNEKSVPLAACKGYLISLYTLPIHALLLLILLFHFLRLLLPLILLLSFHLMFLLCVIVLLVSLTGDTSKQSLLSFRYGYIRACFTAHGRPCTQSLRKMV